jgi:hypothetical protein
MGITAVDIARQREMLERGEQIRREIAEATERQRLRDQFATAALTGLLARPEFDDDPIDYRYMCRAAYKWADAMMQERRAEPPPE